MGRKRNLPVVIDRTSEVTTEVPIVSDGLPTFQRYVDIPSERQGTKVVTRWFFVTPNQEEINQTVALYQSKKTDIHVLGASMPYMNGSNSIPPLFEYCLQKGFSEDFSANLVRLEINLVQARRNGRASISAFAAGAKEFVDWLSTNTKNLSKLTLTDISKETWMGYLQIKEADPRTSSKKLFNNARMPFVAYGPTALGGWLGQLTFTERRRKPSQEHTSEMADTRDYSDVVMYQILALCIEGFQRRIGYLKHYESLTEADLPVDWLYSGRKKVHLPNAQGSKGGRNGESYETEQSRLLFHWLNDEDDGYQVLIDHHIMHHKAGLIRKHWSRDTRGGIKTTLAHALKKDGKLAPLVRRFNETMALRFGFDYGNAYGSLLNFYVNKKTAGETNTVINQIAWCLANLLMMQSGINKEVALTIPSRAENGKSILTRADSLFVSSDERPTEIELYGIKERTGNAPRKVISISIPTDSPLYEMLLDYERHVKLDNAGPFFEVNKSFARSWSKAGGLNDFTKTYPLVDENGAPLSSVDTTRFRKVFASGQLLNRLKGIKNANDLAEKLREDLHHDNLDVTITHYLLKSSIGRSVIDTAIATITSDKLEEGLRFRGKISLTAGHHAKKKVFLCDCEDPTNPTHDVAIADECKHYDLCLGCERAVITKQHLPYVCLRILQYEEARRTDPHIWPATYEDRWNIAHNTLDRYASVDKKNGKRLVEDAWIAARERRVSLPPIIISNRT